MKNILLLIFIITACVSYSQETKQYKYDDFNPADEYIFVVGTDYDTRSSFSLKSGVTRIDHIDCSGKICMEAWYQQLFAKYNFTTNAIGLQGSFGYSTLFLGGRIGFDYEHNFDVDKGDFSLFVAGGIDIGGAFSLVFGPKFNLTQNLSGKLVTLHIGLEFPPSILFVKDKRKKFIR